MAHHDLSAERHDGTDDASRTAPPPFRLRLEPGFIGLVALLAACGYAVWTWASDHGLTATAPLPFTLTFTAWLLGLVAVHEASHVLAARAHGHTLVGVRLGARFGVTAHGEHTHASQFTCAAAGPAVGLVVSGLVLTMAPVGSALWFAAVVAVVQDLANATLFFMPGSDASRMRAALHGLHAARRSPAAA